MLLSYRELTEILAFRYGVNISKEHVRKTLKKIDSDRVTIRRKKIIRGRMYQTIYLVTFTV